MNHEQDQRDNLVGVAEIADWLKRPIEDIRQLISQPDFPEPVSDNFGEPRWKRAQVGFWVHDQEFEWPAPPSAAVPVFSDEHFWFADFEDGWPPVRTHIYCYAMAADSSTAFAWNASTYPDLHPPPEVVQESEAMGLDLVEFAWGRSVYRNGFHWEVSEEHFSDSPYLEDRERGETGEESEVTVALISYSPLFRSCADPTKSFFWSDAAHQPKPPELIKEWLRMAESELQEGRGQNR